MSRPLRRALAAVLSRPFILPFAVLLVLLLNLVVYLLRIDSWVLYHDYWRFLTLLESYHAGTLDLEQLLGVTNSPLKSPLLPLLFLADGVLLDLELRWLHLGLLLAYAGAAVVVVRHLGRVFEGHGWYRVAGLTAAAVLLLSPMLSGLISYGQAILMLVRVALYLVCFVLVSDALLAAQLTTRRWLLVAIMIVLAVVLVGGPYLPAFLGALVIGTGTWFLAATTPWRERGRRVAILGATTAVSVLLYLPCLMVYRDHGLASGTNLLVSAPDKGLVFLLRMLAASVTGKLAWRYGWYELLGIGALALLLMGVGVLMMWRGRLWRKTLVPLLLVSYSTLVLCSITAARAGWGPKAALADRYLADTPLWQLGVVVSLIYWAAATRSARGRPARAAAAFLVAAALCYHHLDMLGFQWRWAGRIHAKNQSRRQAILAADQMSDAELAEALAITERNFHHVRSGIETLRRHRLNVYR